jgi:hypothetical protein
MEKLDKHSEIEKWGIKMDPNLAKVKAKQLHPPQVYDSKG